MTHDPWLLHLRMGLGGGGVVVLDNPLDLESKKVVDICQDLKSIGMTWEDAEQSAINREDWRRSVAQCVYDTG